MLPEQSTWQKQFFDGERLEKRRLNKGKCYPGATNSLEKWDKRERANEAT